MNSAAVLALAAELNAFTKFVAMPMRGHGNVTGSDMVMRWTTGYPFGVNLCRGYPRFNPGEFSTVDLLVRGDVDAALVLGADPGATMPQPGIEHLARIPTIVLDPKVTHTSRLARVHITTAATGISAPGTVYRMDEIPLPLRPALDSPYPTDEEVIRRIHQAVSPKARVGTLAGSQDGHDSGNARRAALEPAETPCCESKAGKYYDPANGIDGVVKDLCIADGRIVSEVDGGRVIDATGMFVFPGGVDIHTHVAGAALNFARAMTPENHRQATAFLAHAGTPRRNRRAHPHHVRHRLSLRRNGLHDRHRSRRPRPHGQAHTRRAARHSHR